MTNRIAFRTCPLCEAGCGLEIELQRQADGAETVKRIRGDMEDVLSRGFICPKGSTLKHLHEDPDWLRRPQVKRDGAFVTVGWDEAFETVAAGLAPFLQSDRNAIGIYFGNPTAHSLATLLHNRTVAKALGSRNVFSASTVDQRPKEMSAAMMFGSVTVPVPDLDRTDYLLMLGANPLASNGSLCTAPDFPGRLKGIQERGGTVVVVDPKRTDTAEVADRHLPIRPGTDSFFLAAIATELLSTGQAKPGRLAELSEGFERLGDLLARFTPESVAAATGIEAASTRLIANELAAAPSAAVYGRIGTTCQEFGTLTSWLVDVVNLLTGNLDRIGGAMFAMGAAGQPSTKGEPGTGRGFRFGSSTSRVSNTRSTFGEFPVTVMQEEIETEGDGQIRAMITIGGNPVASNPNSDRLDAAFGSLDFVVCVDPYINETTRHADVILPPPDPLQKPHYDLALLNFAVRNVANYSPAVLPLGEEQMAEDEILLRLAAVLGGEPASGPDADAAVQVIDDLVAAAVAGSAARDDYSNVGDQTADEVLEGVGDRRGLERLLDLALRTGPYGDGVGQSADGLTLERLEASPHGIDLGPLEADRLPGILRTPTGRIELLNIEIENEIERLTVRLREAPDHGDDRLIMIGRRHVRSNNSWMHNVRVLMKGRNRCTLQIHPDDAGRLGIADGSPAKVTSRVGQVIVDAELTDAMRPGVVSIPHGFGQGHSDGVELRVASEYRGVNTNILTDEYLRDPVSGNIALNGVPVEVAPA